jgi:glycogen debranching enzyme
MKTAACLRLPIFIFTLSLISLLMISCGPEPDPVEPLRIAYLDYRKDGTMDLSNVVPAAPWITEDVIFRYERVASIDIPAGDRSQYVFGDNISGYWDGVSHSYRRGNGYQIRESVILADIASAAGGRLLNRRTDAVSAELRPGEIAHQYPGYRENLFLLSGEHAMALELVSEGAPAHLSFFPALATSLSRYDYKVEEGVFLLIPSRIRDDVPAVIAISASVPLRMGENLASSLGRLAEDSLLPMTENSPAEPLLSALGMEEIEGSDQDVRNALKISEQSPLLSFTTEEPVQSARFYVSFGYDEAEALDRARRVREGGIDSHRAEIRKLLLTSRISFPDENLERALYWSMYSGYTMVTRQYGTGIWAGLPWFRQNWGRDTFIALPGILLANGRFEEARDVLDTFARFQNLNTEDENYGRVPNRVNNPEDIIYNTTDGTPWLIREAEEYLQYSGDLEFAGEILDLARHYINGALENYVGEDGLLYHDDADTWMDARIANNEPWSARGDRAVEIQALWYTALRSAATIARIEARSDLADEWEALADRVRVSFLAQFWDGETLADRIRPDGSADRKLRPNQLMAISVPSLGRPGSGDFLPPATQAAVLRNSANGLLYPWGIASLDPEHPYFHPRHDRSGMFHKDAAYHNGTIWGWNAGPALTALLRFGEEELSARLIQNLAYQINDLGARGTMSELVEPFPAENGSLVPSGTFSQAWSVSEFTRVLFQDLMGFRPRLLENTVSLAPMIPEALLPPGGSINARLAFGQDEALDIRVSRNPEGVSEYRISRADGTDGIERKLVMSVFHIREGWRSAEFSLGEGEIVIRADSRGNVISGGTWAAVFPAFPETLGSLAFRDAAADAAREFPAMGESNYLQEIIKAGEFR